MFDESGNLILPKDVFKGVKISIERKVVCPNCGHIIKMRGARHHTICRKCQEVIKL
ncbi:MULTISPECIES: zinc finger domain-containing protein [Acidiplasma]|uniref:zinc finger domain-containing protein n=1 Tax=Acidiplasma TaxID=507753 RepID=UPI000A53AFE0|nr:MULTISPECIES: zinc finger domain-containing protein [Acidiplasma]